VAKKNLKDKMKHKRKKLELWIGSGRTLGIKNGN